MLSEAFEQKFFSGSRSTTNEPNFKILCNCIHELLNVFEDSAQRVHTIVGVAVVCKKELFARGLVSRCLRPFLN